ncbi:hypothetical protein MPLA_720065 [Mesorhizobium sp. ORS 3359]|nr:hypothetical protein MPLA_720065 [Mesorhizobium sp. ORS 3359]
MARGNGELAALWFVNGAQIKIATVRDARNRRERSARPGSCAYTCACTEAMRVGERRCW